MTDRPLRFGILGCARISRRGLIPGIHGSSRAALAAIASRNGDTAKQWAAEFSIPQAYDSYEALLADPNIDAVYLPLPNELHLEWVRRAAVAGKHILCEKPLALDATEAEGMIALCRREGIVLMEAFMWRHHPRVTEARRLLSSGQLGELCLVKMDFSFQIDPNDWRLDPQRGGGALFDLGCYGINASRLFTGEEPSEIFARGRFLRPGVDMTLAFELRFPSGALALLDCSFECPDRNRIEIVGTKGIVELPGGVLPPDNGPLVVTTAAGQETKHFPANQYAVQVDVFCQSVAAGRLVDVAEDGLANMRVIEAVKKAAAGK